MKKFIFFIIIIAIFVVMFFGSLETMPLKKQAKENVLNIFKTKYGITPEIDEINPLSYASMFGDGGYSNVAEVKLSVNGKEYIALVNTKTSSNFGYDNYQYDEIYTDIYKDIKKTLTGRIEGFTLTYSGVEDSFLEGVDYGNIKGFLSSRYEGDNLRDITTFLTMKIMTSGEEEYDEEKIKSVISNYFDIEDIRKQDSFTIVHFNDTNSYVKYNNYSNNSYFVDTDSYPDSYEYINYVVKLDNEGNLSQIGNNVKVDGDISLMGWNIDFEGYTFSEAEPFDLTQIEEYDAKRHIIVSNFYNIESTSKNPVCDETFRIKMENKKVSDGKQYVLAYKAEDCKGNVKYSIGFVGVDEQDKRFVIPKYKGYSKMTFAILEKTNY